MDSSSGVAQTHTSDKSVGVLVDATPAELPNEQTQCTSNVLKMDSIFLNHPVEETTVDEMKIQTMYKMVEDINVRIQGKEVIKKVLYLTNRQANLFDEQAMQRCIQALDIGDPKFVIKLLPSCGVASQMKIAHTEYINQTSIQYKRHSSKSSELDSGDKSIVQSQILLLMRTCILPLAKQTRAVILVGGANDCYLSAALSNVVLAEQARLGKDCPFTVIATVCEFEIHSRAVSTDDHASVSGQLSRGSKAWARRMPFVHDFMSSKGTMQRCDLTPAASRYLVFECIDESSSGYVRASNAKKTFEAVLLQCLTKKLPSIAIQSHLADIGIAALNELAARNIPVLLLDSTERAITLQRRVQAGSLRTRLAEESDAFPLVSRLRLEKLEAVGESLTLEGRQELMDVAFEMIERKWQCLIKYGLFDSLNTSLLAFMHSALRLGVSMDSTSGEKVPLFARVYELERLQRSNKDSTKSQIPPELAAKVISFMLSRCKALEKIAELSLVEKWLEGHDPKFNDLIPNAQKHRDNLKSICSEIEAAGGIIKSPPMAEEWLQLFDILTSANTYSGSIHDLNGLKRILGSVAKLDRLPSANSLESLKTLQDAWDFQELCHQNATYYKYICKVTYVLLLLIGILLTALSLAECNLEGFEARYAVLAATVVGTAISAYAAYTNPGHKWQHLRAAAMAIESNIWMFRTRVGLYRSAGPAFDADTDRLLSNNIRDIKASVVEGADMKLTSFFSNTRLPIKHGQHAGVKQAWLGFRKSTPNTIDTEDDVRLSWRAGKEEELNQEVRLDELISWLKQPESDAEGDDKDSHYAPVQPDAYIRFRVNKALVFYKQRIPVCTWARDLSQTLLIVGSIGSGVLAFVEMAAWVSGVSIVTAAITAYTQFQGTAGRIDRYSVTVHSLQELVCWWQTLPQIDKSVVGNIDRLVTACEDILQREQQAWRSTSQVMRLLQESAKTAPANASPTANLA